MQFQPILNTAFSKFFGAAWPQTPSRRPKNTFLATQGSIYWGVERSFPSNVSSSAYCILGKLHIRCVSAQYMRKICARLLLFLQCTRFAQDCSFFSNAQDLRKIVLLSPMRNICTRFAQDRTSFSNGQYMRKIVLISPVRNICARFAQDFTYFSNAQDLRKIVVFSPMRNTCTRFAQDCTSFPNGQYMCKIVLISPVRNICARFAQDCTYFSNAQYMHKICARLYYPMCKDCRHYWKKYVTYHISALNLEWYSLHSYFWIATGFDFFLNKHL